MPTIMHCISVKIYLGLFNYVLVLKQKFFPNKVGG